MTSRHASGDGRRGMATWVIVTGVAVVALIAATVGYLLIVRNDGKSAQGGCTSHAVLPIVASPGAAPAIGAAATAFDATEPVARSACVSTAVTVMPGTEAEPALATDWTQDPAPAIWVPDTAADLAALEAANSGLTAGRDTTPMAISPVVLAVRSDDATAVATAGVSWQGLAAATGPNGTVTLPDGRHLIVALPNPTTNRATSYALQSVVATGGGTVDAAAVTAAASQLAGVGDGGPATQPATTEEALIQLAAGTGGFTAVPVVESDLAAFTVGTPGLTAISPTGGTVGDAIYPVPLTAGWVTPTLDDAAALFLAYLRSPAGAAVLIGNGLRVVGSSNPAPSTAVSASSGAPGGSTGTPAVPDAGQQVAAAIAAAIGAGGPAG